MSTMLSFTTQMKIKMPTLLTREVQGPYFSTDRLISTMSEYRIWYYHAVRFGFVFVLPYGKDRPNISHLIATQVVIFHFPPCTMSLSSALRTATLELLRQIKEREETDPPMTIISKAGGEGKNVKDSSDPPANDQVLSLFMRLAGEPITWIEAKELWNDMRSTNAGELPMLKDTIMHASWRRYIIKYSLD